jgi:type III secretion protein R
MGGVALVALVAIVPIVVLMLTSFVKMSVVLALLRNALGAPEAPSGLVVMGVSLVLTFFVMAPVAVDMVRAAAATAPGPGEKAPAGPGEKAPAGPGEKAPAGPGEKAPAGAGGAPVGPGEKAPAGSGEKAPAGAGGAGEKAPVGPGEKAPAGADGAMGGEGPPLVRLEVEAAVRQLMPEQYRREIDAAVRAVGPLRAFLGKHAAQRDRETFAAVARRMGRDVAGDETWILAPAFLTTELREAFAIAVLIFIPFLVIDLVVALGLAALGLQTTQPQIVALPLKLLLFVAVDGWRLLIDGLLRGYA